ncbi:MAG TPA: phosphate ABC transporter permease subunit PstC [Acidobacteriota bacterium]|nr:phosphate ABC transporter permease subunit PstC [Acidobacteriota bacterium]HPB28032.1 phosphate ABC transporter permease subunit PstC [Acidobacteriota bacterium]HQO25253.1 phosphate ABC transporter permease subunit PstC [Acidobacteriota bacterium]HQP74071.1 phosphate ABC transporter permease subunit PstC [Acidobacteriota bacterium]
MRRERLFRNLLRLAAWLVGLNVLVISITLFWGASPTLRHFGLGFLWSSHWNPVTDEFGALPFLAGTLATSFLALALSLPLSLSMAILLGEFLRVGWLSNVFKSLVDLIAAVPSVIFGYWGLMVLVPLVREAEMWLMPLGQSVGIEIMPYGVGVLTASLVLAVMIIPNTAAIAREVLELVPRDLKEAAYSFGATRYEVVRSVIVPYARSGIFAGILLSLGRALGETMAVTMVIGNTNEMPANLFAPANTMASVIANELAEATTAIHYSSLVAVGLVLFLVTTVINFIGTYIIKKMTVQA